jgi:hypothetical protein
VRRDCMGSNAWNNEALSELSTLYRRITSPDLKRAVQARPQGSNVALICPVSIAPNASSW